MRGREDVPSGRICEAMDDGGKTERNARAERPAATKESKFRFLKSARDCGVRSIKLHSSFKY